MNQKVDKNTPEYLQSKANSARYNLLLVVLFTVINIVLLLTQAGRYFLFSAAVPYQLVLVGAVLDLDSVGALFGTYTITGLVLGAAILGLYVLCMLLSKKRDAWYVVAVVLFALDTVLMVLGNLKELAGNAVDLLFHAWVLYELINGVVCSKKLKRLQAEAAAARRDPDAIMDDIFAGKTAE